MKFIREKIQNYYLFDTSVENVFINEYMIDAPGDFVKVYLIALMYGEISMPMNHEAIAKQLSLDEEDVLKAWTYWEGKGVIEKEYPDPENRFNYNVKFINLKELIYGKNDKGKKEKIPAALEGIMNDRELKKLYSRIEQITGRLFEGNEPAAILDWIQDYDIPAEIVIYAYDYCVNKRNNSRHNYVAAVVKEWAGRGFRTIDQIEEHLQQTDNRYYLYKRVLKALGFSRNPTEEEKRIMDTWFDDMNFDIGKVLQACKKTSGISNPNINYINTILKSWSNEGKGTTSDKAPSGHPIGMVMRSYEEERNKNVAEAEARRIQVYKTVPRVQEIENEMREIGMEISKIMLAGGFGAKSRIKELKKKSERLSHEKAYLLTDNNFPLNYMDTIYTCSICKDTGMLDTGERCPCFSDKLERLEKRFENQSERRYND